MPRLVRVYLLACMVLAFGYLALHSIDPVRLSVGDPWTDASLMISVGTTRTAVFRVIAILCSALAAGLMFQWARGVWNDKLAVIATALTTTSLVWMQFADGLHRVPVMHAACFLALWGTLRALETSQRRHYAATFVGTFVCLAVASNDWLFLPFGVLFTIQVKGGGLSARGNWKVLAACAFGVVLALAFRKVFVAHPSSWQAALDRGVSGVFAALSRRYTALLNPTLWITLAWALWRGLRAPTVKAAVEDGTTWMFVAAAAGTVLLRRNVESATLHTQVLLPLYAIGSGLLITRLFEGGWIRRLLAAAWCVIAPLWGIWLMVTFPRAVIARDDLARANEYLAQNDRNSFVMSNLLADGPLLAAFGKHGWVTTPRDLLESTAQYRLLEILESTGTDYVHAVIFTTPASRFTDRTLAQLLGRRMASIDGWPSLMKAKVNENIQQYDKKLVRALEEVGAKRVLQLDNFEIYRVDRQTALETVARSLPAVNRIDFQSPAAAKHRLLGWGDPNASIAGFGQCWNPIAPSDKLAPNRCTVVSTSGGLDVLDVRGVSAAEAIVRIDRVCDQEVTLELAAPSRVNVSINGTPVLGCKDPQWGAASAKVTVPRAAVRAGSNIIRFEDAQSDPKTVRPEVKSISFEARCE